MSTDRIMSLIDLAGTKERYKAYVNSVKNVMPKQFKNDQKRYFSIYVQMMQEFLVNPKVSNKKSILTCMFNAPKLGLNPDKVFGHIYFIPYKGVLTYQIGYKGMIQLSFNSGMIKQVYADLVYENDEWDFYRDEKGQHFLHRPKIAEKNRGREICGYSVFEDVKGNPHIHVMDSYHIDDIKKLVLARMKDAPTPWKDSLFEPEMRKKTVIRRHWKTEPMSAEIAEAIESEERNESGEVPSEKDTEMSLENILDYTDTSGLENPDPKSTEGKKLNKELDMQLAAAEKEQGLLPFK